MQTWTVALDFRYDKPLEQPALEDALEDGLSAMLEDPAIEGGTLAANSADRAIWSQFDVEADTMLEALDLGILHARAAIESAGVEISDLIRAEIVLEAIAAA